MNKQLYNFVQDKLQKNRNGGQIKSSALAIRLYEEFHFGQFDLTQQWLTFTLEDILALRNEVQSSLDVDIRNDCYPSKVDRLTSAEINRNEKENSFAVSKDFILINSLSELNVNQTSHKIPSLTSLGLYVKADDIQSVEHSAIILVENLAVMANLKQINFTALAGEIDLSQALWLYRGDVKAQQTTNTSYHFFRRFKGQIPLVCFSDIDPKGIEIAITSDADYCLTLKYIDDLVMPLSGTEQEWYKQGASITFLQESINSNSEKINDVQGIFNHLLIHRKTLKQEHILKHQLALTLLKLN